MIVLLVGLKLTSSDMHSRNMIPLSIDHTRRMGTSGTGSSTNHVRQVVINVTTDTIRFESESERKSSILCSEHEDGSLVEWILRLRRCELFQFSHGDRDWSYLVCHIMSFFVLCTEWKLQRRKVNLWCSFVLNVSHRCTSSHDSWNL
jgi:hypothetical protein